VSAAGPQAQPFAEADLPAAARLAERLRQRDPHVEPLADRLAELWRSERARRELWRLLLDGAVPSGLAIALERGPGALDVYAAVAPSLRRRGLGTRLLRPALDAAARDRLALHAALPEGAPGRAFLESLGFGVAGRSLLIEARGPLPSPSAGVQVLELDPRQEADRAALTALSADAFAGQPGTFPLSTNDLLGLAPPAGLLLVAARGGTPAAHLVARRLGEGLVVEEVGTLPKARRQGLARALLAEAQRRTGARALLLAVDEANAPAAALYRSLGFRQVGARLRLIRPAP
jgi:ribosomal protein S18 acetylase RimI-like enzyme